MLSYKEKSFILLLMSSFVSSEIVTPNKDAHITPPLRNELKENKPACEPIIKLQPIFIPIQMTTSNSFKKTPQQDTPTTTTTSTPQNNNNNFFPNFPWLATPSGVSTTPVQLPTFNPQINTPEWLSNLLPPFLSGMNSNNAAMPMATATSQRENLDLIKNLEELKEPYRPSKYEPYILSLPDPSILIEDEIHKDLSNNNRVNPNDALLLNLLQRLGAQKRVQERIGAVYLRDLLLNRK